MLTFLIATHLVYAAPASEPAPAPAVETATTEQAQAPSVDLSGKYAMWALNQRNFLLGADHPLNDADYVVQMLRIRGEASRDSYGVVMRADLAQGWWGADNSPDVTQTPTTDADGNVTSSTSWNPYKLFGNKDTNYGMHVDQAYAYVLVPRAPFPVEVRVGRQYYKVGHKLVLDQDGDGVQVLMQPTARIGLDLAWAKLSEGTGSVRAPAGTLMSDDGVNADADLFGATLRLDPSEGIGAELYGLYYQDNSGGGLETYAPNGLGYLEARFRPNLSMVSAFGFSSDASFPVAGGLKLQAEGAYLIGRDDVANTDHAGGLLDINNGELSGWTAFLAADQTLGGVPLTFGASLGVGSGDDDPTGGKGNINKVMTQGFFPFTNVWEDSVMPDVEGISPQGLGSPVSRGYREFENTLALQGRLALKPHERVKVSASYSYFRAMNPVLGFDATGLPTGSGALDLGQEVDVNLHLNVYKGFDYACLFGVFMPGDAAGNLILGSATDLAPAWEVKQVVTASF